MIRSFSTLFAATLAAVFMAQTAATHAEEPASEVPLLSNAAFSEIEDGMPVGWVAFTGGVRVENGYGGSILHVGAGALGINWLVQSIPVHAAGYDIGVYTGGDALAGLRVAWYATADGSGAALGSIDATERGPSPSVDAPITLATGPFAMPGHARSLRAYLLVQGPPAAEAVFTGMTIRTVDDPPAPVPEADASPSAESAPSVRRTALPVVGTPITEVAPARTGSSLSGAPTARIFTGWRSAIAAPVKINEVGFGAAGAEWVELYNAGARPVLLDGWSLAAGVTRYPLPPVVIPAHGFVVLTPNEVFLHTYPAFRQPLAPLSAPLTLARQNGVVEIIDADGHAVDVVAWGVAEGIFQRGAVPAGHSLERRTAGLDRDLPEDFVENAQPTPGEGFALNPVPLERTKTATLLLALTALFVAPVLALIMLHRPRL